MKVKVKNTKKGVKITAVCESMEDLKDLKYKVMELIALNAKRQEAKK